MGLGHNDPWVESHMWPQQTWVQRSLRGSVTFGWSFWKKGHCIHILWCIFKSNITMITKVCDRESRRDLWFENRLVQEKVTHLYTNQTNFAPNFDQNHPIVPIFLKLERSNLGKFWKINPFLYQILHFNRGHSYIKRLILLSMLAAHPHRVFRTEYPPGHSNVSVHTYVTRGFQNIPYLGNYLAFGITWFLQWPSLHQT